MAMLNNQTVIRVGINVNVDVALGSQIEIPSVVQCQVPSDNDDWLEKIYH